jgi:hypothetical protein
MSNQAELTAAAAQFLGDDAEVLGAGIFGLQDDYAAITVAGAATGLALDAVGSDDPVAGALTAGITVHATRDAVAKSKGLSVRMLVAVTPTHIHIMDYPDSGIPSVEYLNFDRSKTAVQVTKFGLSRHLNLADPEAGQQIGLTGSTAFFSSVAAGDKMVLHLLES